MYRLRSRYGLLLLLLLTGSVKMAAQCPPNIGFETGGFQNWVCSVGNVDQSGTVNMFLDAIVPGRHTIIDSHQPALDPYGHFPISSANGSRYCIKLGNDHAGSEAERVSYTFTVPPNQNDYSIIYDYAVVFQDPGHLPFQQPRFTAKVFDVASGQYLQCSSYNFIASANLPGFLLSDVQVNGSYNVFYKPWSLASIKLSGFAGKAIRLEFTTNDCTANEHFGYAYIDVNNDCNTIISGNNYCNGMHSVKLTAPFGFENYYWYDAGLTRLLGSTGILSISPPPPDGTIYGLIVQPYPGSGCSDTLYTTIKYQNVPFNFSVADPARFCLPSIGNLTDAWITSGSSNGLAYSYFTDSLLLHYVPNPDSITINGIYFIKAVDNNGCTNVKPVSVIINNSPVMTVHDPAPVHYPLKTDITSPFVISGNTPGSVISYWYDAATTLSVPDPTAIDSAGIYYLKATNDSGCSIIKPVNVVITISQVPNIFSPNGDGVHDFWEIPGLKKYPQCDVRVFNRYGQLVFHSTGYSKPWDGKVQGKQVPTGTYYYVIRVSNRLPQLSGFIDVIY